MLMPRSILIPNEVPKKQKSKYKGVFRVGKKFKAQIQACGVQHYLGLFDTEEEAAAAYEVHAKEAAKRKSKLRAAENSDDEPAEEKDHPEQLGAHGQQAKDDSSSWILPSEMESRQGPYSQRIYIGMTKKRKLEKKASSNENSSNPRCLSYIPQGSVNPPEVLQMHHMSHLHIPVETLAASTLHPTAGVASARSRNAKKKQSGSSEVINSIPIPQYYMNGLERAYPDIGVSSSGIHLMGKSSGNSGSSHISSQDPGLYRDALMYQHRNYLLGLVNSETSLLGENDSALSNPYGSLLSPCSGQDINTQVGKDSNTELYLRTVFPGIVQPHYQNIRSSTQSISQTPYISNSHPSSQLASKTSKNQEDTNQEEENEANNNESDAEQDEDDDSDDDDGCPNWMDQVYYWTGTLLPDKASTGLAWKGSWLGSFSGRPETAEFAASSNAFEYFGPFTVSGGIILANQVASESKSNGEGANYVWIGENGCIRPRSGFFRGYYMMDNDGSGSLSKYSENDFFLDFEVMNESMARFMALQEPMYVMKGVAGATSSKEEVENTSSSSSSSSKSGMLQSAENTQSSHTSTMNGSGSKQNSSASADQSSSTSDAANMESFSVNVSLLEAAAAAASVSSTVESEANSLFYHVVGRGDSDFGPFILNGTLEASTGLLDVQRLYVAEDDERASMNVAQLKVFFRENCNILHTASKLSNPLVSINTL